MKTNILKKRMAVYAVILTLTATFHAAADQTAAAVKPDKSYTGTVVSVNPNERTLEVKGFLFSKKFNLGTSCAYTLLGKPDGTIDDVRSGQKILVGYQDANGVLVADRIQQEPMNYTGMVKAVDPVAHTITVHSGLTERTFQIGDDCNVVLHNDSSGTLANIEPGDHVTVTFETPDGKSTARQIAQTRATFTGELTALDLGEKTLKAKALFGSMKFNVADNCAIVINGKTDGKLSDLRPNEKLVFSYDIVDGVNVVNRIAPAPTQTDSIAKTPTAPAADN